ncbi:MAG: hypothetical protein HC923_00625 [Myxococcales bacterium]|nr:hypothetical protein [Myxococcales bacterium]
MLDAYIIEELKRREAERRRADEERRRIRIDPDYGRNREEPRDPEEGPVEEVGEETIIHIRA